VLPEPGSTEAGAVWDAADRRVSSWLLYPEARAALARARRVGRFQPAQISVIRQQIESLWRQIDRLDLTAHVTQRAGDLADAHGLRGYDAVHLASAEEVADAETVFVCCDRDLGAAAQTRGLGTVSLPA